MAESKKLWICCPTYLAERMRKALGGGEFFDMPGPVNPDVRAFHSNERPIKEINDAIAKLKQEISQDIDKAIGDAVAGFNLPN